MRPYRHKNMPKVVGHPLVGRLIREMMHVGLSENEMAKQSGINRQTLNAWRLRTNPKITDLEACFNVLGYTLEPVRKKDDV